MIGIAVGVASLLVVTSVMNGFYQTVQDILVDAEPHVQVSVDDAPSQQSLLTALRKLPRVLEATPTWNTKAALLHEGASDARQLLLVQGFDSMPPYVRERIVAGASPTGAMEGIVLPWPVAQRVGLSPRGPATAGSRVALYTAPMAMRSLASPLLPPMPIQFEVTGLIAASDLQTPNQAYVSSAALRRLAGDQAEGWMAIRVASPDDAAAVKEAIISGGLAPETAVQTWYERHAQMYEVMRLEKWGAMILLLLIVVVAVFNVIAAMMMMGLQKRSDMAIMMAMGATPTMLRRVFFRLGLWITGTGVAAGLALGGTLVVLQSQYGIVKISGNGGFLLDAYPVYTDPFDVLFILFITIALGIISSAWPALLVAKTSVSDTLRGVG